LVAGGLRDKLDQKSLEFVFCDIFRSLNHISDHERIRFASGTPGEERAGSHLLRAERKPISHLPDPPETLVAFM
jgi:hypothetical protein